MLWSCEALRLLLLSLEEWRPAELPPHLLQADQRQGETLGSQAASIATLIYRLEIDYFKEAGAELNSFIFQFKFIPGIILFINIYFYPEIIKFTSLWKI